MYNKELSRWFYRSILKIHENADFSIKEKCQEIHSLLQSIIVEVTKKEKIQFNNLFARIDFAAKRFAIDKTHQFYIHTFRRLLFKYQSDSDIKIGTIYDLGRYVMIYLVEAFFQTPPDDALQKLIPDRKHFSFSPVKVHGFKAKVRCVVMDIDMEREQLIARDAEDYSTEVRVQFNIAERNQNFNKSIKTLGTTFPFPVSMNLIDVEIDDEGVYRPRAFVIEPDYLIDVTAIAECFKDSGAEPLMFLLKKFMPFSSTKYLVLGNIANFLLDELMTDDEINFKDTFAKVFQLSPLAFANFNNSIVREIHQKSQKHYVNLRKVIADEFPDKEIEKDECFLESAFYSEKYGIQGRLDIFYKGKTGKSAIVELKSGKIYRPNRYGVNQNHYTQTLLYDLLTKSVFGKKLDPSIYMLYSGIDERQLRYAPSNKTQQMEALQVRNMLIATEWHLEKLVNNFDQPNLLNRLNGNVFPNKKGFDVDDLKRFARMYENINPLMKKYFLAFTSFIAREHRLAKVGIEGVDNLNGIAGLWRTDLKVKQQNFNIISQLNVIDNQAAEHEPILTFNRHNEAEELANFRLGDIAVLYIDKGVKDAVLHDQVFKCTIIGMTKDVVTIRLRASQSNSAIFNQNVLWNLEHDSMEMGFTSQYRSLFEFAEAPIQKQDLLLTQRPPNKPDFKEIPCPEDLTDEQKRILAKAMNANEYFLLWGPPGTGKTSKMLRSMVDYLFHHTQENILLLAYTNKAVDEICEAIVSIGDDFTNRFLRIGNPYSSAPKFKEQLLIQQLKKVKTRKELIQLLESKRIFVGTVASFAGKADLLKLINFDRVIIDEASQILEPNLVGLLQKFKRFILVGDHKQLPAVVMQDKELSKINDGELNEIGIDNLRNSFFERLYRRCQTEKWDWAYDQLSYQGRMHEDIMAFPNRFFYENKLNVLPKEIVGHNGQYEDLDFKKYKAKNDLESDLMSGRLLYIPTTKMPDAVNEKVNVEEAERVVDVIRAFMNIYEGEISLDQIGIITPFRAQIAQILETMEVAGLDTTALTVDTVERYQGGAREIIIISSCANNFMRLQSMISISEEGIDRKLNVAMTRAKKHLVLLGNESVLKMDPIYKALIDFIRD